MRRALPFGLLVLLIVPLVAGATDPNAAPTRETDENVTAFAVAGNGAMIVGTEDPDSVSQPDRDVWYYWQKDGALRLSGDADPADCTFDCYYDVVDVAISKDGSRFVIVSWPGNDRDSLVTFGGVNQGVLTRQTVSGEVTAVSMSDTGGYVAVATHIHPLTKDPQDEDPGEVTLFRWDDTITEKWSTEIDSPPVDIDVSPDGTTVSVAASKHYRFDLTASSDSKAYKNEGVPGKVLDVDNARGSTAWSVAGTQDGYFAIFSKSSHANPSFQEYQRRDVKSPLGAVAIREDHSQFAVGNRAGDLWLYKLDTSAADMVSQLQKRSGLGAVESLAYSADGQYLAAAFAGDVALYHVGDDKLTLLWSVAQADNVGQIGIDKDGDRVVAATGTKVFRYDALHDITRTGPTSDVDLTPGGSVTRQYTFKNDGNRYEEVSLSVQTDTGVSPELDLDGFALLPGASKTVTLTLETEADQEPGGYTVELSHSLASGGQPTRLSFETHVVENLVWSLTTDGPPSKAIAAGGAVTYGLTLENTGNIAATPSLDVTLEPSTWSHEVAGVPASLAPGEMALIDLTISAPADAMELAVGEATVSIEAMDGDPVELTATVGARFGVRLDGPASASLEAGESTTFQLQVRNSGNALDTFVLEMGAVPAGWTLLFPSGASVWTFDDVAGGQSKSLTVTLEVPESAAGGVPVQIQFTASSLSDPDQTASKDVQVDVIVPAVTETETPENGTPALSLVWALVLVGVAAVLRRR